MLLSPGPESRIYFEQALLSYMHGEHGDLMDKIVASGDYSDEIEATFSDCECGAIPAIGDAYGVDVVLDPALTHQPDVYFESGDHEHLIHMRGEVFRDLMEHVPRTPVSHHL